MDINDIIRAIDFADDIHKGRKRIGTELPFVTHPFAVGLQLADNFSIPADVIVAGFIHHTIEHDGVTLDTIRNQFGQNVADLVEHAADNTSLSWQDNKYKLYRRMVIADRELKLLVCADNYQNLLNIKSEYRRIGEAVWSRLHGGRSGQAWYYRELSKSLEQGVSHCNFHDFRWEVNKFFGWEGEKELEEKMAREDALPFAISTNEETEMLQEVSNTQNREKRWSPFGAKQTTFECTPDDLPVLVAQGCSHAREGKLSLALLSLGRASDNANGCSRLALVAGNLACRTGRLLDAGRYFDRIAYDHPLYIEGAIRKGRTYTKIINRWRKFGLAPQPVIGWYGEGGKIYMYELIWHPDETMVSHLPAPVKESLSRLGKDRHLFIELSIDTLFGEGHDDWPVYGISPVMAMGCYMNSREAAKKAMRAYFRRFNVNADYKDLVNEVLLEAGSDLQVEGEEMPLKDNWWHEIDSLERGDITDKTEPIVILDAAEVKRRVTELYESQREQRESMRRDKELYDL
jgi:hypothetical protein